MDRWYKGAPLLLGKTSKSIIHPFNIKGYGGLTVNPYQGCQHRCAYCYATYEWSPEFYDKIYAKSNAPEVLERQLRTWKQDIIQPVMVASATDPYQPAEVKYGLTRRCIEVLQKYGVPYYVFTKSVLIGRDLELHRKYKDNCFVVWSITTCDEKVRRIVEPGTPPAGAIFGVIKKFTDAGICCAVNVDPVMPLITDTHDQINSILRSCHLSGIKNVGGAILRLRTDIWDRMKMVIRLLEVPNGIEEYKKIYNFQEPLKTNYLSCNHKYAKQVMDYVKEETERLGMEFEFPDNVDERQIDKSSFQTTLSNFL